MLCPLMRPNLFGPLGLYYAIQREMGKEKARDGVERVRGGGGGYVYLACVLLCWAVRISSSLAYPASSSSRASCACTSAVSRRLSEVVCWLKSWFVASSPWLSVVVKVGLNRFDECPPTGVETDDVLMTDSPNAESVWPSLLLKSETSVSDWWSLLIGYVSFLQTPIYS